MDRRNAIMMGVAALASVVVGVDTSSPQPKPLRAVWKWIEESKQWIRVRLYEIKTGEWLSIEKEVGSKERYVGIAVNDPVYHTDVGEWGIDINGYMVTVE